MPKTLILRADLLFFSEPIICHPAAPVIPDVAQRIVAQLEVGLTQIKTNWIKGIYLTGSIPLSDFYPQKSDIDFVVLCNEFPTQEITDQLHELHQRIQHRWPKPVLNGVYLTRQNLLVPNITASQVIHFQDGRLSQSSFEMGPITLYELKTVAFTVSGMPVRQLPIDIDLGHVRQFMHTNINSYWQQWVRRHTSWLHRKGLLVLFPVLTEWGILGVARQLHTLKQGEIVSKRVAGIACLETVPAKYRPIIEQALTIRMNTPSWTTFSLKTLNSMRPSWRRATLTTGCMQYLIDEFNQLYLTQD